MRLPRTQSSPLGSPHSGTRTTVQQQRRSFIAMMLAPATVLLLGLTLFPFLASLALSFTNYSLTTPDGTRVNWGYNYVRLLSNRDFWNAFRVTATFTIAAVTIETLLGLGIALLLHAETRGVGLLRTIYMLPMAITPVAATFTFRLMFSPSLGVFNYFLEQLGLPPQAYLADPNQALASLILVDAWQWTPFVLLILVGGLAALPLEPFELRW